jgi:formylglycine-generating enzyme required for sulfatase activity
MSSLADLRELVGFFSYSREDDEGSHGALSALRERIQHELRAQLGRTAKTFRLWQDKEAIPSGTLWEGEIKNAVEQAVFFIPIITPTVIASPYCRFELDAFLAREAALGRSDLVFPILYIDVPALADNALRQNNAVLSLIAARQYVDWRKLRHLDVRATDVSEAVERFCAHIRDALQKPWVSPRERQALEAAEAERQRQEAKKRRREDEAKQKAAEEERRKREAAAEQKRAEAERQRVKSERLRKEAEAKRREHGQWHTPRPLVLIGSVIGLVLLGTIGAWLGLAPTPGPVPPPEPTQQAANAPLSAAQELALKPGDAFQECTNCPVMKVVPAGSFAMAEVTTDLPFVNLPPLFKPFEPKSDDPGHRVAIARQFAVGQFELTFDQWDACIAAGGCNGYRPSDEGWGGGSRPVINVNWCDASAYVAWLAKKTAKRYRLLSEAEYE